MEKEKIQYKALIVRPETHHLVKVSSAQEKKTVDQYLLDLLKSN